MLDLRKNTFRVEGGPQMDLRKPEQDTVRVADQPMMRHSPTSAVVIQKKGSAPITFKKGALHRQLGVPEGQPIPAGKKKAALAGKYGPLAKKRASFAFKGALAAGRKTAAP